MGRRFERGIDIEFAQDRIGVDRCLAGQDFQAFQQRLGFLASMRFDNTYDDVDALLELGASGL